MELNYENAQPRRKQTIRRWAFRISAGGGSFLATLIYLVLAVYIGRQAGISNALIFLLLAGAVLLFISRCFYVLRRRRSLLILTYLLKIVQSRLPVVPMLRAAAESEGARMRSRLEALARECLAGVSLTDALIHAAPEIDQRVISMVHTGERHGAIEAALQRVIQQEDRRWSPLPSKSAQTIYVLTVSAAVMGLISLVMIFLLPRFEQVCRDFAIELPWSTQTLISLRTLFEITPILALVFVIAMLVILSRAFYRLFSADLKSGPVWYENLKGAIQWRLPIFGAVCRHAALGDFCSVLAQAAKARLPLPRAVFEAGTAQESPVLRRQALVWSQQMEGGKNIVDAAQIAGFPQVISTLVGASVRVGKLSDAMDYLMRYYDNRFSASALLARYVAGLAFTLLVGAFVALVALAIFEPIQRMVTHLSPAILGI